MNKKEIIEDSDKIEHFETRDVVNSCYFVCQNLTSINLLLILILFMLAYMYFK